MSMSFDYSYCLSLRSMIHTKYERKYEMKRNTCSVLFFFMKHIIFSKEASFFILVHWKTHAKPQSNHVHATSKYVRVES